MPIHDVGYRTWKGRLTAHWSRWWTISEAGIRTALKSRWIRRVILASWFPVIYFGILFFVFETIMETSSNDILRQFGASEIAETLPNLEGLAGTPEGDAVIEQQKLAKQLLENQARARAMEQVPMVENLPNADALFQAIDTGDESRLRHTMWNWLLSTFMRYPQGLVTLMIVGLIVPPLISRDVRSRAFLLYYSRPITRFEYMLGKFSIPASVLLMVTLVPALFLYVFGVMLSPDLTVLRDTWDIPFRIVIATAVCVIPTALIGLLFSSMTQESRFAGFAWFTVWGLGAVVWWVIYMSNSDGGNVPFDSNWSLISIYSTIGRVQAWIFGLETDMSRTWPSIVMLTIITVLSFLALNRRVSAPVRA